jgi:hypothetical protein
MKRNDLNVPLFSVLFHALIRLNLKILRFSANASIKEVRLRNSFRLGLARFAVVLPTASSKKRGSVNPFIVNIELIRAGSFIVVMAISF